MHGLGRQPTELGQHPLRLAQRVAQQYRDLAGGAGGLPPAQHVGGHLLGRRPAVDRQAEGGFGNEGIAGHDLERRAGRVGIALVVAGMHPYLAADLDPHLRRAEDVTGRVQRHPGLAEPDRAAVLQPLQLHLAQPLPQQRQALPACQVAAAAGTGMVGVGVGDDRADDAGRGIDVEIAGRAVQPGPGRHQQIAPACVAAASAHLCGVHQKVLLMSATAIPLEPELAAQEARLRYVSDQLPGYRRRRCGRGFRYHDPRGQLLHDASQRAWIRSLTIPPAWEDVWISPYRNGHILATGRDEKGRKQYIYHPRWTALRAEGNFQQLLAFGEALPALRARVDADLRRPRLSRERVLALVVRLLEDTLIRVGNAEYAQRNRSYGLTTLRSRHLALEGSRIHLEFRGKSGKMHAVELHDRRAARVIRQCQELPGQELFQYVDEGGERCAVDSADVNDYLHTATGEPFTAKVFRTW